MNFLEIRLDALHLLVPPSLAKLVQSCIRAIVGSAFFDILDFVSIDLEEVETLRHSHEEFEALEILRLALLNLIDEIRQLVEHRFYLGLMPVIGRQFELLYVRISLTLHLSCMAQQPNYAVP